MRRTICCLMMSVMIALAPVRPAHAFIGFGNIVLDPSNLAQNVLTAARTLQMINNQIKQLTNEAQMLINEAQNLANLPYTARAEIQARLNEIQRLIASAKGVAFTIAATESYFAMYYPQDYAAFSNTEMTAHARARWEAARHAFHDALVMHAQIAEIVEQDVVTLDTLVTESQSAVGNLQVAQAGNQLLALNTKQSLQTQQLLAAQYRAETIERSRAVAIEEAARVRHERFVGDGVAYSR